MDTKLIIYLFHILIIVPIILSVSSKCKSDECSMLQGLAILALTYHSLRLLDHLEIINIFHE